MGPLKWLKRLVLFRKNLRTFPNTDFDAWARRHLASISLSSCTPLSPYHILPIIPDTPQPAGRIWHDAAQQGHLPCNASFNAFYDTLLRLCPALLSLTPSPSPADAVIAWQPWVPPSWRSRCGDVGSPQHIVTQLCEIVPTYFVSVRLVREEMRRRERTVMDHRSLQWHQLTDASLAPLLEWGDGGVAMRLAENAALSNALRGAADDVYGLHKDTEVLHEALRAIALLVPSFTVPLGEVRGVYASQFLRTGGVFHNEFSTEFFERFPDALSLVGHRDVQFALEFIGKNALQLRTTFLHLHRETANVHYTCLSSYIRCNRSPETKREEPIEAWTRTHLTLPHTRCAEDAARLSFLQNESFIGLHCKLDVEQNRIFLFVATATNVVIACDGDIAALRRLDALNISHGGLPTEILDALRSPSVLKFIVVDSNESITNATAEKRMTDLIHQYFKIDIPFICSLWRLALFVGFPVPLPSCGGLSRSFMHSLLTRAGVTASESLLDQPALLAATCAVCLLFICDANDRDHDMDVLHQMLTKTEDNEMWLRWNLYLRIRRYGVPPITHASLASCLQHLKTLSAACGPEFCILNMKNRDSGTSQSELFNTMETSCNKVDIVDSTMSLANSERDEVNNEGEGKDVLEEKEEDDEAYLTALGADLPSPNAAEATTETTTTAHGKTFFPQTGVKCGVSNRKGDSGVVVVSSHDEEEEKGKADEDDVFQSLFGDEAAKIFSTNNTNPASSVSTNDLNPILPKKKCSDRIDTSLLGKKEAEEEEEEEEKKKKKKEETDEKGEVHFYLSPPSLSPRRQVAVRVRDPNVLPKPFSWRSAPKRMDKESRTDEKNTEKEDLSINSCKGNENGSDTVTISELVSVVMKESSRPFEEIRVSGDAEERVSKFIRRVLSDLQKK